jgi:Cu-Zn family superoxide dismutase
MGVPIACGELTMKHALLAIALGLGTGVAGAQAPGTSTMATATLTDARGGGVGEARLQQTPNGVLLMLDLRNATPGVHALHIHEVGKCDAPSFESAGGHFEPAGRAHGFLNPRGPHAGDLPNIHVPDAKRLSVEYLITSVTLDAGPRSLLDANGSALVIHAGKDDYTSDPAGEAGDRLACGPIVR